MKPRLQETIRKNYSKLTKSQRALSQYILKNITDASFLSLSALAQKVEVSDASVTRFCLALGYNGYADFQRDLRGIIQIKLHPSQRVEKATRSKRGVRFLGILDCDIQNLKDSINRASILQIQRAVQFLNRSRRIYIIGLRSSFSSAYLLSFQLGRILPNVSLLDPAQGLLYDTMIDAGPKDSLIGISFPPYTKTTQEVAQYAQKQGCKIVALTDSIFAPLATISDVLIRVKIDTLHFIASYTAVISVINCIAAGIADMNSKRTLKELRKYENAMPQSDIWVIKRP